LTDLFKGSPNTLEWTTAAEEAFEATKHLLTKAVPLQHPSPQAKLSLAPYAYDFHIGGIMQQKSSNRWCPFVFYVTNLSDEESRYSTFGWELVVSSLCIH
jgi:hypothetical protein